MNLENKNSFLLNSALFFSTMGSTATTLGFITYIFNTTHSPFNTGAVTIATLLVGMLLGPFLGILVKEKGLMWSMVVPEIVSGFILLIFIKFGSLLFLIFELLGIEMPRFLGNTPNGVRLTKLTRAFRPRWIPIV